MKRIIALLLAVIISTSLVGCGKTMCSIEGCGNEAVTDDSFEEILCSKHLADKKVLEGSKEIYDNIKGAYKIASEYGADLIDAWWVIVFDADKLIDTYTVESIMDIIDYLDEESLKTGVAYCIANNIDKVEWDSLSDADKEEYIQEAEQFKGAHFSDFNNRMNMTLWSIRHGYKFSGRRENAEAYLESAKELLRELDGQYPEFEYYSSLKAFWITVDSYLDSCDNAAQSFETFSKSRAEYEEEIREHINNLDFNLG